MPSLSRAYRPTWVEIDLSAIRSNFHQIRTLFPKVRIIAVVKADAYGHGMLEVAKTLQRDKTDAFGVSNIDEAVALRKGGLKNPILVFESLLAPAQKAVLKYKLTSTICDLDFARLLNASAGRIKRQVPVHIKVDTGMGRLGVWYQQAVSFIKDVSRMEYLHIEAMYTHFPSADCDRLFTRHQVREFSRLRMKMEQEGIVVPYVHVSNSMGILGYQTQLDFVRPGIMLYGLSPKPDEQFKIKLIPAMSLKSTIVFLKDIPKGRSVSYGRTFVAKNNMTVATIPVGYNDGYLRCLSNKSFVLVRGVRCRVIGRVTMDQMMIDVTKVNNVRLGDEVVLLGRQGREEISADELARMAGTINYEIVCALGNRGRRRYIN